MSRHLLVLAATVVCWAAPAARLEAAGGTITDQAVSLTYASTHWGPTPMADLRGTEPSAATDLVYQTGWWYRLEGDTREYPFPAPTSESYVGPSATLTWDDVDGRGFGAKEYLEVLDNERPSGTFTSRLALANHGATPLGVTVFHYLDADAAGTAGGDSGTALSNRLLAFGEGDTEGLYRSHFSSAYMVRPYPEVRDLLNDDSLTELTNTVTPFGPGDWSAAYQWSAGLGPGEESSVAWVTVSSRVPGGWVKGDLIFTNNNPDVVFWRPDTHQLQVWNMRRAARVETFVLGTSLQPVGVDAFTGRFENDLVVYNTASGAVSFTSLSGGSVGLGGAPPLPLNWRLSATADFDHDGQPDILWRNLTSQRLVIWTMNGTFKAGNLVPSPDHAVDGNWEIVGARDFDGDGNTDLLWYNATSGKVVIWRMDASVVRRGGGFTTPANAGDNNWRVVATADYGKGPGGIPQTPDLLWRNATSGKLVLWHLDWSGTRTAGLFTTPDGMGDPAWTVAGPR